MYQHHVLHKYLMRNMALLGHAFEWNKFTDDQASLFNFVMKENRVIITKDRFVGESHIMELVLLHELFFYPKPRHTSVVITPFSYDYKYMLSQLKKRIEATGCALRDKGIELHVGVGANYVKNYSTGAQIRFDSFDRAVNTLRYADADLIYVTNVGGRKPSSIIVNEVFDNIKLIANTYDITKMIISSDVQAMTQHTNIRMPDDFNYFEMTKRLRPGNDYGPYPTLSV